MGAYYTLMQGLGVTNFSTTFLHSLSIAPASLVANLRLKQNLLTVTAPLLVLSYGTNAIWVASGVGTLVTFDLEVMQVHSIQQG